ncbi:uncharacterized protein LOC124912534 isoform X2 [Impatiens glandulifera]|uniref:uncharacterized protein LOC124912534 isoform X2 n=1 Tax=Impatiens glandulifera TaxID=253017 RepID=UPI001FB130E3|nr:uncharacterized protein LOC124912534 isoform X2 [Impatiens glandulifera]
MDSEFGDFSWLTNMQHKFESLLPDVDDVLSDERLKYVEDQFQTVGSNIQTQLYAISTNFTQFCSELAHDVLSPSSSILNEACRENEDIIPGKGNSAHLSSFLNKNEKILLPDRIELVDKVIDQNVKHAAAGKDLCLKSSLAEKCKDCRDKEEATVSVYGAADELSIQDDVLKSRTDSYMENIGLAKEVTVWDNYFTSDWGKFPISSSVMFICFCFCFYIRFGLFEMMFIMVKQDYLVLLCNSLYKLELKTECLFEINSFHLITYI